MCGLPQCQNVMLQPLGLWVLWGLGVLSCPLWVSLPCSLYHLVPLVTASLAVQDHRDGEQVEQSSWGDTGALWGCNQAYSHCPTSQQASIPPVPPPAKGLGPASSLLPTALVPRRCSRQGHRVSTSAGHRKGWGGGSWVEWDQRQGAALTGEGGDLLGVLVCTMGVTGSSGHAKCHCPRAAGMLQGCPGRWAASPHPSQKLERFAFQSSLHDLFSLQS